MGLEGSHAARSSDFAIPRFKHLKRLLAVHGRFALIRNAYFIQYSFYKNLILAFGQVIFSFYTLFSGQTAFDSWYITFFNMLFTFVPPIVVATFEKDVNDSVIYRVSIELYIIANTNRLQNCTSH